MQKDRKFVIFFGLAAAFGVLFFGLLFGILIYNSQTETLNTELSSLKVRNQEIILFSNLLQSDLTKGNINCEFYSNSLNEFSSYLNEYGRILERYYGSPENLDNIRYLQKDYVVAALNLYLSIDKFNTICSSQKKDTLLYFYPYNCGNCDGMTRTIYYIVADENGAFSFSIPSEVGLESVNFMMQYYDINVVPSVVVNGNSVQGPYSFEEIKNYLYYTDNNIINN